MRYVAFVFLFVVAQSCAPKPTEKVDLAKARASLELYDGSSISLDDYDDVNPILLRLPGDYLVLIFESDRPCANCSGSYYNLFVAESVYPYTPGADLPPFYDPVVINAGGSPLELDYYPGNFQATYSNGVVNMVFESGGYINYASLPPGSLSIGDVGGASPIQNTTHLTDRLIGVDYRTLSVISTDGYDVYSSKVAVIADPGTIIYNDELLNAASSTRLRPFATGYPDGFLYEHNGQLAVGTDNYPVDLAESFNDALDYNNLTLSYVSVYNGADPYMDLVLFSAADASGLNDLYVVDSHTLFELLLLDFNLGYQYYYDSDFRIFNTGTQFTGNIGGVAGADAACNNESDPGSPDINALYQAMIVAPGQRNGAAGSQIDWVMYPNVSYINTGDGQAIGTTNASGILSSNTAIGPAASVWTGMTASFGIGATHCASWLNGSSGTGVAGNATTASTGAFVSATPACTAVASLYCVEQ